MNLSEWLNEPIGHDSHFKWKEALWLPRWQVYAMPPAIGIEQNIESTALKLNIIRQYFGAPLIVTSWYRPQKYNVEIGGSTRSAHIDGLACDFIVKGHKSENSRKVLYPLLKEIGIRMEDYPTPHIHIDLKCTEDMSNEERFFKPYN